MKKQDIIDLTKLANVPDFTVTDALTQQFILATVIVVSVTALWQVGTILYEYPWTGWIWVNDNNWQKEVLKEAQYIIERNKQMEAPRPPGPLLYDLISGHLRFEWETISYSFVFDLINT